MPIALAPIQIFIQQSEQLYINQMRHSHIFNHEIDSRLRGGLILYTSHFVTILTDGAAGTMVLNVVTIQ